ncbi:hypothetical protein SCALM49S_04809 [Streptomyces californicus]
MDTATRLRQTLISWAAGDTDAPHPAKASAARELAAELGLRTVVLVEGVSDRAAVEALAVRRGRDLTVKASWSCRSAEPPASPASCGCLGRRTASASIRPAGLCDAAGSSASSSRACGRRYRECPSISSRASLLIARSVPSRRTTKM